MADDVCGAELAATIAKFMTLGGGMTLCLFGPPLSTKARLTCAARSRLQTSSCLRVSYPPSILDDTLHRQGHHRGQIE